MNAPTNSIKSELTTLVDKMTENLTQNGYEVEVRPSGWVEVIGIKNRTCYTVAAGTERDVVVVTAHKRAFTAPK